MANCTWSIRPFPGETQVSCEKQEHVWQAASEEVIAGTAEHRTVLRDYAWPGSATEITWLAGDRREFSGEWPGYCTRLGSHGGRQICTLPAEHRGSCAP
jgi:hypothetical protein